MFNEDLTQKLINTGRGKFLDNITFCFKFSKDLLKP